MSSNITWHASEVTDAMRRKARGHAGAVLWLTGLSGAGKSTLAARVEHRLTERGVTSYVLDGDNVRHGLCGDLGFSAEDRKENIRRVGEVARLFADAGVLVITAFISPYREDRAQARALVDSLSRRNDSDAGAPKGEGRFVEVHVAADLGVCESRDPKGLYARARAGEIANFTGIDAPYEAPEAPELAVDTGSQTVDESAAAVIDWLEANDYLSPGPSSNG